MKSKFLRYSAIHWSLLSSMLLISCSEKPAPKPETGLSPYIATAKGRVDVEGGLIKLSAPTEGILRQYKINEGDTIKADQMLAQIDDQSTRLNAEIARAELAQAQTTMQTLSIKLAAAEREISRISPLAADNTVEKQSLDTLQDQRKTVLAEMATNKAAIAVAQKRLRLVEYGLEMSQMHAPVAGKIIKRMVTIGEHVSTGSPILMIEPDAPHIIRGELEERFINDVKIGQAAEIILEADDTQRFTAKVLRIGQIVGNRSSSDDPQEKQDAHVVDFVLSIDAPKLLIGQRVIVRILR